MSNVDTINRLAKDIAERFGSDINAASEQASCEFNQLYTNILIEVDRTFGTTGIIMNSARLYQTHLRK